MKVVVETLHEISSRETVEDATQFFSATIANAVGPIPEDVFSEMEKEAADPCDRAGCECHVWSGELFKALRLARSDYAKTIAVQKRTPNKFS